MVLAFLQIFALLSWYGLENSRLTFKTTQHFLQRQQWLNQAEYQLRIIETHLLDRLPPCTISREAAQELIKRPLDWWHSEVTCAGNFQGVEYHYVVEWLGDDPCAELTQMAARYYRITLLFQPLANNEKLFLQSTLAKPANLLQHCDGLPHAIIIGRQQWREI